MIGHGVPGLSIRQEHDFPAHGAAIFDALTLGIDAWWPAEARVCGQGGRLTLAPELGAALVEQGAGGAAAIWGVVDAIEPARRLYLNGWFGVAGVVSVRSGRNGRGHAPDPAASGDRPGARGSEHPVPRPLAPHPRFGAAKAPDADDGLTA